MRILRVSFYHNVEVFYSFFMVVYHLISFGPFMNVPDVRRYSLNAKCKRVYRFLKFFKSAICQTNVIVNIVLVSYVRIVAQALFQGFDALFVFFAGIKYNSKLV
jgi:hypothetical protein